MRNINFSAKKAICSICVIMALWTLGVRAATLPPDPDNAALLYYQAFLLRPEPDANTSASIDEVISGGEPDEKLREYLNLPDCRETIEFADAAAQLPRCDWGIQYSLGIEAHLPLLVHFRRLSFLIYADAVVLATDEEYRAALSRCMTIRQIAGHVGDDILINYLISLQLDGLAHRCTRDILGSMPPDADVLTWLRGRLVVVRDVFPSFVRALEMDFELSIQSLRTNSDSLMRLREHLAKNADDENTRNEILGFTDEELIALIQELYEDFFNTVFHVMDSKMTYEQKFLEIQSLSKIMEDKYAGYSYVGTGRIAEHYNLKVRNEAQFNALKAAIEIYLVAANTGQLPQTLPDYLPKDPFSGQDFEYEITEKGFLLRCRAKDILASQAMHPPGTNPDVVHEYEFELRM
jgi:hypothetical protein